MTLTARQNLEEQKDEIAIHILELEQELIDLREKEKIINVRIEAMNDVLMQSAQKVKLMKAEDFDKLAGDF